jgi:lysylphosphatidylglycerol synthetase-like protein (DUF2156 family)
VKGYGYSIASIIVLAIIFEYLQETYFTTITEYLYILIPLASANTVLTYLGFKNLKKHKLQKAIGFMEIIFLIVVLNSALYLVQLHTLTSIERDITILVFGILTVTLIVAIMNIAYEGEKKIVPLDYGEEA